MDKDQRQHCAPATHRTPVASKTLRCVLAALLATSMLLPLAGCKESDVLTQKIIGDVDLYEVDYSLAPVALDNPESEESLDSDYEEEDSEQENDLEEDTPEYDEEETTDETIDEQVQSDYGNDSPASTGDEDGDSSSSASSKKGAGSDEGTESGTGRTFSVGDATSNDDDDDDGENTDDSLTTGDDDNPKDTWTGNSSNNEGNSGSGTSATTIVSGDYDNLPSSSGVAAAGQYALIVQALCPGGLKACNAEWYDDLPLAAFDGKSELEGAAKISAWGDGTSMNEETFQAIVDSGADTVITSLSYGGVTDQEWADRFNEEGINVIELPAIGMTDALDADIETCVEVIGELLKDSGYTVTINGITKNSSQMATLWANQHDTALEKTVSANGGYAVTLTEGYSLTYIYQGNTMLSSAVESITRENTRYRTTVLGQKYEGSIDGSGANHQRHTRSAYFWPYGDYCNMEGSVTIDYTGICVCSGASGGSGTSSLDGTSIFNLSSYYLQCAGIAELEPTSTPMPNTSILVTTLVGTGASAANSEANKVYPGSSQFPAIIARNEDIANCVDESANIADRASCTVGYFNFGSTYRIYIVPSGVAGNWLDGTFESFLMAPWAYEMFTDFTDLTGGSIDLSGTEEMVSEFYDYFYRCSADGIVNASKNYWASYLVAECPTD